MKFTRYISKKLYQTQTYSTGSNYRARASISKIFFSFQMKQQVSMQLCEFLKLLQLQTETQYPTWKLYCTTLGSFQTMTWFLDRFLVRTQSSRTDTYKKHFENVTALQYKDGIYYFLRFMNHLVFDLNICQNIL